MKYVLLVAFSFVAILVQMVVGYKYILSNFLDLSLILVAYWAIYRSRTQALFVGSLTGLLLDAVLGWPLGYNGFAKTFSAYIIGQADRKFNVDGSPARFALLITCSLFSSASIYMLFRLFQRDYNRIFLEASLLQALITAGVGVLGLSFLDRYQSRVS